MKKYRLFFGIFPNDAVRNLCNDFIQSINLTSVKWVNEQNRHITSLFIGDFPVDKVNLFAEYFSQQIAEVKEFNLIFEQFTWFPLRYPSMIWAKFKQSEDFTQFVKLSEKISAGFIEENNLNLNLKNNNSIIPHITLSRLKNKSKFLPPLKYEPHNLPVLIVSKVILLKSELLSDGAKYNVLHDFSLKGS